MSFNGTSYSIFFLVEFYVCFLLLSKNGFCPTIAFNRSHRIDVDILFYNVYCHAYNMKTFLRFIVLFLDNSFYRGLDESIVYLYSAMLRVMCLTTCLFRSFEVRIFFCNFQPYSFTSHQGM